MDTNTITNMSAADFGLAKHELATLRQYRAVLNDAGLDRLAELEGLLEPPTLAPPVRTFLVTLAEGYDIEGADAVIADALARHGVALEGVRPVTEAVAPNYGMFSVAGNVAVGLAVADRIDAGGNLPPVDLYAFVDAIAATGDDYREAGDTAVRELVAEALEAGGVTLAERY